MKRVEKNTIHHYVQELDSSHLCTDEKFHLNESLTQSTEKKDHEQG